MATGRIHTYQKKSSKYKYVAKIILEKGIIKWNAKLGCSISFDTEREAAIFVDKKLISMGKEPINILIRKQK